MQLQLLANFPVPVQPSPWIGDYGQIRFAGRLTETQYARYCVAAWGRALI